MSNRTIDKIFDALRSGGASTFEEISRKTHIQIKKLKLIITFLQEFRFIEMGRSGKIKLNSLTRHFLEELDKNDPKASYEEITA